jgi:hypothetical protein
MNDAKYRENHCWRDLKAILKSTHLALELKTIDNQIAERNEQIHDYWRKQE